MESEKWTAGQIKTKLVEDDAWVCRGLLAIYKKQTPDEQTSETTNHNNGVGFNRIDAEFLSSLAKSFMRYGTLTPKQIHYGRKRLLKYTKQLVKIANQEI